MGCHNEICEHAVIGGQPQHVARPETVGQVLIGDHNVFREGVTVHRALKPDGQTIVGDHNYLMAAAHLGHDVQVGNHCILANSALAGGHVQIEDRAFVSGAVAIHQFCRIGRNCMIGGCSKVVQDALPFMITDGNPAKTRFVNQEGLKRKGISKDAQSALKQCYKWLCRDHLTTTKALEKMESEFNGLEEIQHLAKFIRESERGIAT